MANWFACHWVKYLEKSIIHTIIANKRVQVGTWLICPLSIRHILRYTKFVFIVVVRLTSFPVCSADLSSCRKPYCAFFEADPGFGIFGQQIPDFLIYCTVRDVDQEWICIFTVGHGIIPSHFSGLKGVMASCCGGENNDSFMGFIVQQAVSICKPTKLCLAVCDQH